jgi:hypothetical protein
MKSLFIFNLFSYIFSDAISVAGGMITGYLIIKNMAGSGRGQSLARTDRKIS